jgi:hypothetical protein
MAINQENLKTQQKIARHFLTNEITKIKRHL